MTERRVLDSWKQISSYLRRSERTCRTWETANGLPVHRIHNSPRARVFAYADELDRWLQRTVSSSAGEYPIAVLPLRNLSTDGGQDQLADALTEGLIAELGSLSAFRVISRRSVWRYRDSTKALSLIGRELGVKAVVDGSVLRSGDRVRISAALYQTSPERRLWADDLEREMTDVLDLQRDIVRDVALKVEAVLTPGQAERLSVRRPVVPDAYEEFMKGLAALRGPIIKPNLEAAVRYFEEAIRIDGGFALAFAEIGWCYGELALYSFVPPSDALPKQKAAALRAVELDPLLAQGHAVLANAAALGDWDWTAAEKHFCRALELDPNSFRVNYNRMVYLCWMGRLDEMADSLKKLRALDPIDPYGLWIAGWGYFWARRYDESIAVLERMRQEMPSNHLVRMVLGIDHWFKGMGAEAGPACARARAAAPIGTDLILDAILAFVCAKSGSPEDARSTLAAWSGISGQRLIDPTLQAIIHTGLGDKESALACLEKGYAEHAPMMVFLKTAVFFDELREEPRFRRLLGLMKFPESP